jgi:hypothetical protein
LLRVCFINKKDDIPEKHVEVVLRDIGHQLLLSLKMLHPSPPWNQGVGLSFSSGRRRC